MHSRGLSTLGFAILLGSVEAQDVFTQSIEGPASITRPFGSYTET